MKEMIEKLKVNEKAFCFLPVEERQFIKSLTWKDVEYLLPNGTWCFTPPATLADCAVVRLHPDFEMLVKEKHKWDRDGERCIKCGAKDWMGGECRTQIPIEERWLFNPASMDIVAEEFLVSNGFSKKGWIEISKSQKRYLETKPEPVEGFEWVLVSQRRRAVHRRG